jgi:hypothetical protein
MGIDDYLVEGRVSLWSLRDGLNGLETLLHKQHTDELSLC